MTAPTDTDAESRIMEADFVACKVFNDSDRDTRPTERQIVIAPAPADF